MWAKYTSQRKTQHASLHFLFMLWPSLLCSSRTKMNLVFVLWLQSWRVKLPVRQPNSNPNPKFGVNEKLINAQSHRAEILILISPPFYNFNIIVAKFPSQSWVPFLNEHFTWRLNFINFPNSMCQVPRTDCKSAKLTTNYF